MAFLSGRFSLIVLLLIFHPSRGKTWRTRASSRPSSSDNFSAPASSYAAASAASLTAIESSTTSMATATAAPSWQRSPRYAKFEPPKIFPSNDFQTVKAGTDYTFRCEGSGRGVSWRLPNSTSEDWPDRISHKFYEDPHQNYVTEIRIKNIVYSDTGTFICSYNGTVDLTSIDNSSNVHLFVDDGVHLLKYSSFEFFRATQGSKFTLPCMPTMPEVNVTLWRETSGHKQIFPDKYVSYNPKVGFNISPVIMKLHSGEFICRANFKGREEEFIFSLTVLEPTKFVPLPYINQTLARHVRLGETFNLTCSVIVDFHVMVELTWTIPNQAAIKENRVTVPEIVTRNVSLGPGIFYKQVEQGLTLKKSQRDDQGLYDCKVEDHSKNKKTKTEFIRILEQEEPYVRITFDAYSTLEITLGENEKPVQWVVQVDAHPPPTIQWFDPFGRKIDPFMDQDYEITTVIDKRSQTMLKIKNLGLSKSGNFMVKAFNEKMTQTENFTLIIKSKPKVQMSVSTQKDLYQVGEEYTMKCSAKGFPVPNVYWTFKPCDSFNNCDQTNRRNLQSIENRKFSSYGRESILKVVAAKSGQYSCQACNDIGCTYHNIPFFVTDIANNGFSVEGPNKVMVGESLKIKCSASVYNFSQDSIEWFKDSLQGHVPLRSDTNSYYKIRTFSNELSFSKEISFDSVNLIDKGRYVCKVAEKASDYHDQPEPLHEKRAYDYVDGQRRQNRPSKMSSGASSMNLVRELSFDVVVLPLEVPEFVETNLKGDEILVVDEPSNGLMLKCKTEGRPRPTVSWFLHGSRIQIAPNTTRVQILEDGQVLQINYVTPNDEGLYECRAENKAGSAKASKIVQLLDSAQKDALYSNISLPIVVIVGIAICLVVVLIGLAKWFYHRRGSFKEQHRPQTPRLTQYELPQNHDDDDCRMTLTSSVTRDGSISPNDMGHLGNHLMSIGPQCQESCHCHTRVHQPCHLGPSVLIPPCTLCELQTLNRMGTLGSKHTLRRYDPYRSRSHSPRLSAEF